MIKWILILFLGLGQTVLFSQPYKLPELNKAVQNVATDAKHLSVSLMASSMFHEMLNDYRRSLKLKPLQPNHVLWIAASNHNLWMAATQTFSHSQKNNHDYFSGVKPSDRIRFVSADAMACHATGENIVSLSLPNRSQDSFIAQHIAQTAFDLWRNSSGHNRNMTQSDYTQHGIAFFISDNKVWGCSVLGSCNILDPGIIGPVYSQEKQDFIKPNNPDHNIEVTPLKESWPTQMLHSKSGIIGVFKSDSSVNNWINTGSRAMRKTVQSTAIYAAFQGITETEQDKNKRHFYATTTAKRLLKASYYTRIFHRNRRYSEMVFLLKTHESNTCSSQVLQSIHKAKESLANHTIASSYVHVYKKNSLFYTAWVVLVV